MLDEKKRELSNIRRLEALKAKKQGRNAQTEQIKASLRNLDSNVGTLNKKTVFHSDESDDDNSVPREDEKKKEEDEVVSTKLTLFPSDSEEDGEDNFDQLKIQPEFKRPKTSQVFEETGDERFQLSNIFMEDSGEEEQALEFSDDEKDEKQKNKEILESVLGFQLPRSDVEPVAAKKRKQYVRFNPEDENAEKYLRKVQPKEKDKTVGKEKEVKASAAVAEPQVSAARYFEVSADLKSALQGTNEKFQLSKMFGFSSEQHETNDEDFTMPDKSEGNRSTLDEQNSIKRKKTAPVRNVESLSLASKERGRNEQHPKFFILPGDPRLTEGVKFFRREKSVEEIHEDFYKTRKLVLEILKKRHRRGLRAPYVVKNKR